MDLAIFSGIFAPPEWIWQYSAEYLLRRNGFGNIQRNICSARMDLAKFSGIFAPPEWIWQNSAEYSLRQNGFGKYSAEYLLEQTAHPCFAWNTAKCKIKTGLAIV